MTNTEHNLGLSEIDIPLYDPTRLQKVEDTFFALFCCDYLAEFGFPLSNVKQLHALVVPTNNMMSTSGFGAGVGGLFALDIDTLCCLVTICSLC